MDYFIIIIIIIITIIIITFIITLLRQKAAQPLQMQHKDNVRVSFLKPVAYFYETRGGSSVWIVRNSVIYINCTTGYIYNIFSIFTKRHKFHFPTFLSSLLAHGVSSMRQQVR